MVTLKEVITHLIGLGVIGTYVYLLLVSASNPDIQIPSPLSSMALIIIGFYFGMEYSKKNK